ncbi:unnamed protein product [Didymodactylos carnosus]|uniref:EGF-like domain-containing protein n=1 Tax=Didymodactylos carnosus TaxID=1234261 RepID=A0A814J150_9BILA|nr:unnamed protein product [Didymodactylos carnosus]CAF3802548.1 unnamed protein product [Didymodactylos carnosus]
MWNCKNGTDEKNCDSELNEVPEIPYYSDVINYHFRCTKNEHYCIKFINNFNDINMTCLPLQNAGDGVVDCIGGTDERLTNICTQLNPLEFDKRFYCMNSTVCITPKQVCDGKVDCPFSDDELVCPGLWSSNSTKDHCKDVSLRCPLKSSDSINCPNKEDIWFCDLDTSFSFVEKKMNDLENWYLIDSYPRKMLKTTALDKKTNSFRSKRLVVETSDDSYNLLFWKCNRGILMQTLLNNNDAILECLCSPGYYGDYCQYQSRRITVLLKIVPAIYFNPSIIFRLIIYLLNENDSVVSHEEIVYNSYMHERKKHMVYLIQERFTAQRPLENKIRIDCYLITLSDVQYISSWLFNISFPFLPVNRLAAVIALKNEPLKGYNCKKINCGSNGICMYYINWKEKEFCWCNREWFSENCDLQLSSKLCNKTSCSPHSQCVVFNNQKAKCICPLGKYGPECYINYDPCANVVCENNGSCLPLDNRNFGYVCVCSDAFKGTHCEMTARLTNILINISATSLSVIPAVVHICVDNINKNIFHLFKNILSTSTFIMSHTRFMQCEAEYVHIFFNITTNFYYMIKYNSPATTFDTSLISENLCPSIGELFNETVLYRYTYLKRLKLYHKPCQLNLALRCFFDEHYMCLCTRDHNSECAAIDNSYSNCQHCYNHGWCIERNPLQAQWDYVCLCPKCYFGTICQFTTGQYFITLDILVGAEMITGRASLEQQPIFIKVALGVLILILIVGLVCNTCSIIIFCDTELRQIGCGIYLLYLSIVSQAGLIIFGLRFTYMLLTQMYVFESLLLLKVSCVFLEYFVRLIPSIFDWLTVCVACERAYTVMKGINFTKNLSLKTVRIAHSLIPVVFLVNILSSLHRPFNLNLVDEPTIAANIQGHPWCLLNFNLKWLNSYEIFMNLFHLILPFSINLASTILFLLYIIKKELLSSINKTKNKLKSTIIKEQLLKYKPIIISPLLIILSELPRLILTFVLACIEYKWQIYLYFFGYLASLLPLTATLFIYVLPSPNYKKKFNSFLRSRFGCK